MSCVVCHAPSRGVLCPACSRHYDRHAHDVGSIAEVMEWAADRAVRMRGTTRERGAMVSISFTADEIVMLHDRVSAGAEVSEESGWNELLDKVETARGRFNHKHGRTT